MEFERAGILGQTFTMRKAFITVFILGMAIIGNAQQENSTTTKLAPPVLKNERSTPPKPNENFKYPPPVIKDERGNIVKPNAKTKKLAPPVPKKKSATSTKKGSSN